MEHRPVEHHPVMSPRGMPQDEAASTGWPPDCLLTLVGRCHCGGWFVSNVSECATSHKCYTQYWFHSAKVKRHEIFLIWDQVSSHSSLQRWSLVPIIPTNGISTDVLPWSETEIAHRLLQNDRSTLAFVCLQICSASPKWQGNLSWNEWVKGEYSQLIHSCKPILNGWFFGMH